MKDLELSGLELKIDENRLIYNMDVFDVEPKVRLLSEAREVYIDKETAETELYFMYRYFEGEEQKEIFEKNDLEYDITVLNNGKVGEEYIKTSGHYHGLVPGTDISYPEVYEVVKGKIEYLCQTKPNENNEVDVIWIVAEEGNKIVVPPKFGHISINVGDNVAVETNLQKSNLPATADYDSFKKFTGGAFYRTNEGLKQNENYKIKSLRIVKPLEKPEWGLTKDIPLYTSFIKNPEKFKYLLKPEDYDFNDIFEDIKL